MAFWIAFLALAGLNSSSGFQVGQPAPPITLSRVLQAPAGTKATLESLRGKAVVLEFWATWCAGCRDQIPHLNRLAEQFHDKPVQFISITDEDPGIVQRFLKDYTMRGWIGLDSDGATFNHYGITGRPQTVLVNASGLVRGIGSPSDLTGETIENFLAGKPIVFSSEAPTKQQSLPDPLFEVMVRPAAPVDAVGYSPGFISTRDGRRFEMWGVDLPRLLSEAYDVPEGRIEAPGWARENRYDVAVAYPDLTSTRQAELLQEALRSAFQLRVHKEPRATAVYLLERLPGTTPTLHRATSTGSSFWGKDGDLKAVALSMTGLAALTSRTLGRPVLDETGIEGRFDFELRWDAGNAKSLIDAVRDQLGLDLMESTRPLDYLVVDSAVPPRVW